MSVNLPMRRSAALRLLIATVVMGVPVSCSDAPSTCSRTETVHLKMTGSCAGGARAFDLQDLNCRLGVEGLDLGLPLAGAVDQASHPIRQGGWQIFGCVGGGVEPCPGQFRRCSTKRVGWQLDMVCLDDSGNPACQAVLTE